MRKIMSTMFQHDGRTYGIAGVAEGMVFTTYLLLDMTENQPRPIKSRDEVPESLMKAMDLAAYALSIEHKEGDVGTIVDIDELRN